MMVLVLDIYHKRLPKDRNNKKDRDEKETHVYREPAFRWEKA